MQPLSDTPHSSASVGSRLNLSLIDILGLILTCSLFASRESLLGDPGVGWHLRAGEWMTKNGEVLFFDPFLMNSGPPRPWVHDQWLSDIVLWSLYAVGGFPLLHLLVAVTCVSVFIFVLPRAMKNVAATSVSVFLALFLGALQASVQWFVRPVIFSFLLFSLVYYFCSKRLSAGKIERLDYLFLPLLFAIWANVHGGFWLGLALMGLLALELVIRKRTLEAPMLFLLCLAATLINPWGLGLWRSTLGLALDPYFLKLNQEWLPPELLDSAFAPFTLSLILFAAGILLRGRRALSRFDYLSLLPLMVLSILHRRYLPFYSVVMVVPFLKLFPKLPEGKFRQSHLRWPVMTPLLWGVLFMGCLLTGKLPIFQSHTSGFPTNYPAAEAGLIAKDPAPVFHTPDVGGFFTWRLWPEVRPFIDDRNQLLGREPYEQYFSVVKAQPGWEQILKSNGIGWLLLADGDTLASQAAQSGAWSQLPKVPGSKWLLFRAVR